MSRARPVMSYWAAVQDPGGVTVPMRRVTGMAPIGRPPPSHPAGYQINSCFPCLWGYLRASAPVREVTDHLRVYSSPRHAHTHSRMRSMKLGQPCETATHRQRAANSPRRVHPGDLSCRVHARAANDRISAATR
jgi:hypothetical protein